MLRRSVERCLRSSSGAMRARFLGTFDLPSLQGKRPAAPAASPQWGRERRKAELAAAAEAKKLAHDVPGQDDDLVDVVDPQTGEWGGPTRGGSMPEPTRFGDWERKGRVTDFS